MSCREQYGACDHSEDQDPRSRQRGQLRSIITRVIISYTRVAAGAVPFVHYDLFIRLISVSSHKLGPGPEVLIDFFKQHKSHLMRSSATRLPGVRGHTERRPRSRGGGGQFSPDTKFMATSPPKASHGT